MNFVVMNNIAADTEVPLTSLQKEKDELRERIMQVDRIIKRVKSLKYNPSNEVKEAKTIKSKKTNCTPQFIPQNSTF